MKKQLFAFAFLMLSVSSSVNAADRIAKYQLTDLSRVEMEEVTDTIKIESDHFESFDFYSSDWFVSFSSIDGLYSVRLDYLSKEKCVNFTEADLIADYSYIVCHADGAFCDIVEASVSVSESAETGLLLEGSLVDNNGQYYQIRCQEGGVQSISSPTQQQKSSMVILLNGHLQICDGAACYNAMGQRIR